MGVSIAGYIEVRSDQNAQDFGWRGAIDLDVLTWGNDKSDPVRAALFGVLGSGEPITGLAAMRGLPHDVSDAVRAAYAPDSTRAETEFGGPTWITWHEIVQALPKESPGRTATWERILTVLSLLADVYGDLNVRLVAWFW